MIRPRAARSYPIRVPTFADIDGDGDLDAFVGQRSATIYLCENTGTVVSHRRRRESRLRRGVHQHR